MNTIIQTKLSSVYLLLCMFILTACSSYDTNRIPSQSGAVNVPAIPEIKRQQTVKPRVAPTPAKKAVVQKPRASVSSSSYQIRNAPVVTQPKKPQVPQLTQQQIEAQQRAKEEAIQQAKLQAQKNATVDIDPFASIPDSGSTVTSKVITPQSTTKSSSSAVKSLMTTARADIALGKSRSAISKLERGLRIEPQNAQLWHMLAKAHYSNSSYSDAISIAKKSNANTNDSDLIDQNWELISQAGKRSGDATAIKEALDYMKQNP